MVLCFTRRQVKRSTSSLLVSLFACALCPAALQAQSTSWLPPPPTVGPDGRFGWVDQSLSVSSSLWQNNVHSLTARLGLRSELYPGSDTPQAGPQNCWNLHMDLSSTWYLSPKVSAGASVQLGATGTRPLDSLRGLPNNVNAFIRLPCREKDAWTVRFDYSPLSQQLYPTPGLGYTFNPSEHFSANIGLPLLNLYSHGRSLFADPGSRQDPPVSQLLSGQVQLRW